jgi:hypothetical protein
MRIGRGKSSTISSFCSFTMQRGVSSTPARVVAIS